MKFEPDTSPLPHGFDIEHLDDDAVAVARRAISIACDSDYLYVATHHLLLSLLEYDSAQGDGIFGGFSLSTNEFKNQMLRIDPPGEPTIHFKLPTTTPLWNCYLHGIVLATAKNRLANPVDIYDGLLHNRESPVDMILHALGIEISTNHKLELKHPKTP